MTNQPTKEQKQEQQIKSLKTIIYICIGMMLLLGVALVFNGNTLKEYKDISTGTYFTDEQCQQMYSPQYYVREVIP